MQEQDGFGSALRSVAFWTRRHLALWIVGAAAANTALLGLVGLVLQLPGQPTARVTWLILVFLVLSVLTVVFPVVGHLVEQRDRATEQEQRDSVSERQRRAEVDRLLAAGTCERLPRLSELSDEVLGATSTFYTRNGKAQYVRRRDAECDYDADLRALLGELGPPFPFVVVWGTTKVGKSRTLNEAARAVFAHDPVVIIPRAGGQALAELVRLGLLASTDGEPALVWLDDLSPADLEALTSPMLDTVAQRAVICATITAKRREEVIRSGGEATGVARAALNRAREFELPFQMSEDERLEAQRAYPEERFDGSIAETLVGGRELITKYRAGQDSNPAGCAIVRSAIDCRRAGLARPVAEPELRHLFPMYLHTVRRGVSATDEQFAEGLKWATDPIASQVALLQLVDPGEQPSHWQVFDHAVTGDDGTFQAQSRPIPTELWSELISLLPPSDLIGVGLAAYSRQQADYAIEAFRKASSAGHPDVNSLMKFMLGHLLAKQGDADGAKTAYQLAIDSAHSDHAPMAALGLGLLLAEQGDVDGARTAYQSAIDSAHQDAAPMAALGLGLLLAEQGDADGAKTAYRSAIDSAHSDHAPAAALGLGALLAKQGDVDGARTAYQSAIDSAHSDHAPAAALGLGHLLAEQGDVDGAKTAYQLAIDSADPQASEMARRGLDGLD